jgi:N-acetylglucosamine kinase-like BadF-type ATPase
VLLIRKIIIYQFSNSSIYYKKLLKPSYGKTKLSFSTSSDFLYFVKDLKNNKAATMKYLIGIDGGATKTECVATDIDGNVLHKSTGGPANFLIIGTDKVCNTLFNLIVECKSKLNVEYSDFQSIILGTTGAGRRSDAEKLENAFKEFVKSKGLNLNFTVDSDARIALEGAFSGRSGSILIAGTGSIMFGKDINGKIHRVGGYGRFIGDQGSGYNIGRKGLSAIAKFYDGRGDHTTLTKIFSEKFKIDTPEGLIVAIYKNNFDIASVAPLVIEAAEKGDQVCNTIIQDETDELILHVLAMVKKINLPEFNLALIGSIITNDNYYSRMFRKKIEMLAVKITIKTPELSPAMGAVLMAKKRI